MTTLQAYKIMVEAAAFFNHLAVKLRNEKITKKAAEAEAKTKIQELSKTFE